MTSEELLAREAIRHRLAAYNMAGDARLAPAFAACFAEDAVFRSPVFELLGRAAIGDWFVSRAVLPAGISFVRHNLGTCLIEFDGPDEANVRTYFTVISDRGADHGGVYNDRFRRAGADWLIAARDIQMDWARDDSLLVPPTARAGIAIIHSPQGN
jgi:hypothetical protein